MNDGTKIELAMNFLDGRKPFLPVNLVNLEVNCSFKSSCKKRIQKQKLIFKFMGQDKEYFASISPFISN